MNRDQKINLVLTAFLIGVALGSQLIADSLFFYLAGLLLFLLIWIIYFQMKPGEKRFAIILIIFGILLGVGRISLDWDLDKVWREMKLDGQKVFLEGEIITAPLVKDNQQSFYLRVNRATSLTKKTFKIPENLLVKVKLTAFPELSWSDQIILEGILLLPENSVDFNYADFLMKDHVYWLLEKAKLNKILSITSFNWFNLSYYLYQFRIFFLAKIYNIFVEPAGGIIAGVLIGERTNIAAVILKDFQITGLTHILAISGFNISLIINMISFLVAKHGKWLRFFLILGLLVVFVIISGAGASVIRAALMGGIVLTIRTFGRSAQILKIILLSGGLMVMVNPRILNFDISFQLSFFATMSLILYAKKIEKWWQFEDKDEWKLNKCQKLIIFGKSFIKEGIFTTIAAQVFTLPIIFYSFGTISLISPLANLLIGPLIPWIMLFGFAAVVFSFINAFLGLIGVALASFIINLMLMIVHLLAKLPFASITLGKGQIWLALFYYLMIFRFFHKYRREQD